MAGDGGNADSVRKGGELYVRYVECCFHGRVAERGGRWWEVAGNRRRPGAAACSLRRERGACARAR